MACFSMDANDTPLSILEAEAHGLPRNILTGPLVVDPLSGTVYIGARGFGLYAHTPAER